MSRNSNIISRIISNRSDKDLFKTLLYTQDGCPIFEIERVKDTETGDIGFLFKIDGLINPYATQSDVQTAISQLGTVFRYKGSKATISELPSSGNEPGDVWYVTATDGEYVWIKEDSTGVWEELGPVIDNIYVRGTGHDSAVLKATPNQADPSVERTNTVTGDFSVVIAGSRNTISATESAAAGGIIEISGGGNNFGTGYRQTLTNCENGFANGYRNTAMNSKQFIMIGRQNNVTDSQNVAVFGRDNVLGTTGYATTCSSILAGRHNILGPCEFSAIGGGQYNYCTNNSAFVTGDHLASSRSNQLTTGQYNRSNGRAYLVVGCGFGEETRKNCFAAGWYSDGATEEDRRVIWIGDTMLSEKQLKALLAIISN